jgi:alpha-beta hydrolase superfamily lysophospholipase
VPVVALIITLAVVGCGGTDVDLNPSGPRPDVKWGKPSDGKPRGLVILLHGGGWQPNHFAYKGEFPLAAALRKRGYATVVIGYDEGATGFREIEQVYSQARNRFHGLPICVHGISAGGTLALMLAAREPDVTCVVGLVTPTDLSTLKAQGGDEAHDLAVDAFGEGQLAAWSPARYADRITAKVLLLPAQTDPVVPIAQAHEFVRRRPATQLFVIPAGPVAVDWLHGAKATTSGAQQAVERGFDFIERSTGG